MCAKKISIVVPVKNGIDTLPNLIEGIQQQTLFKQTEVVIIDSGSTDGSVEFLSQFAFVKVVSINPKTFNHGATRNLGVSHCKGDFIVMTVQDAAASSRDWLQRMLQHFEDDEVAGVCGQQIVPHDNDKNPHEWFRPQSAPSIKEVQFKNVKDFENLPPKEKRGVCGWDDVNAMYRKKSLLAHPFEPVMFGEDLFWAKTALEKGWKLVYDTNSRVHHYHFQYPNFIYRRTLIANLFIYECFNYLRPDPYTTKDYLLIVYRNFKWKCHPKWILHNFKSIYNYKKALKVLNKHIHKGTVEDLKKELAIHIPIGQQK